MISSLRLANSAASSRASPSILPLCISVFGRRCSVLLCNRARVGPSELPRHGWTHELDRTAIDTQNPWNLLRLLRRGHSPTHQECENEGDNPHQFSILDFRFWIFDFRLSEEEFRPRCQDSSFMHILSPNPNPTLVVSQVEPLAIPKSGEELLDLLEEFIFIDRLREVIIATGLARVDLVADHSVRCNSDDRDMLQRIVGLDFPGRLPTVHHRHSKYP